MVEFLERLVEFGFEHWYVVLFVFLAFGLFVILKLRALSGFST
jgi:hypothetical protein